MEIVWYGQSCFRIRGRGCSLVTDPYPPELGATLPKLTTSMVAISRDDANHSYVRALRGKPYVVAGPGEYEVAGIFVQGVPMKRSGGTKDSPGVRITSYVIELEGVTVCHLGQLDSMPTQEQIELFNDVDILLVPVGGHGVLTGTRAAEVVNLIEPGIVIPMQYRVKGLQGPGKTQYDTTNRFFKELAVEPQEAIESLTLTRSQVPDSTRVVTLEPTLA